MNKVFLILVLIASAYGQANNLTVTLGAGASNCSVFLDRAEDKESEGMIFYGSYAQGAFSVMNEISVSKIIPQMQGEQFDPDTSTLRRVLMKYCNENLTSDYHDAVMTAWIDNAK